MDNIGQVPLEGPLMIGGRSHVVTSNDRLVRVGPKSNVSGYEFLRCDFSKLDLSNGKYSFAKFIECNFDGANLTFSNLEGTVFERCSMKGLLAKHTELDRACFSECDLGGATFNHASLVFTTFDKSFLGGMQFRRGHMYLTHFVEVDLQGCDFAGVTMIDAYFNRAQSDETVMLTESSLHSVSMLQCRMPLGGRGIEADNLVISHCDFGQSMCREVVISRSAFSYVIFDDSSFGNIDVLESEFDHCSHFDAKIDDVRFEMTTYSSGYNSINYSTADWSVVTSDLSKISVLDEERDQEDEQQ